MKENSLVNSLLLVAKELEKATQIKKFKKDFEDEMSQANGTLIKMDISNSKEDKVQTNQATLEMEVFEDKEYDIEEVRFWNFISRNKGTKPSVIRTCVYKCPESSYVFTKCTVTKPKKEKNKILLPNEGIIIKKDSESAVNGESKLEQKQKTAFKSSISTDCVKSKSESAKIPQPEITKVNKIKSSKPTAITSKPKLNELTEMITKVSPAQRPIPVLPTQPISFADSTHNYKMEDLILIDEDDDIIDYNEDEDDIQNEALNFENDLGKSNQFDEEDDDDVEDTDDGDEQMELNSHGDDDDNESFHSDDETHLELEKQKDETIKIGEQPKVVVETVEDEPRKKKINLKQKQTKIITSQIENKTYQTFSHNKNNALKKSAVVSKENLTEDRALNSSTTSEPSENENNIISSSSNITITTKTTESITSNFISNASISSTSSISPDATNTAHENSHAAAIIQTNTSVSTNVISVPAQSSTLSSFVDNIISATSALDSTINSSSIFTNNSASSNSISNSNASITTASFAAPANAATSTTTIATTLPTKSTKTNSKFKITTKHLTTNNTNDKKNNTQSNRPSAISSSAAAVMAPAKTSMSNESNERVVRVTRSNSRLNSK